MNVLEDVIAKKLVRKYGDKEAVVLAFMSGLLIGILLILYTK